MGYTPHFSQHVSAVAQDCRDGVFSGTNDLVEKLTVTTAVAPRSAEFAKSLWEFPWYSVTKSF
jgi:hypothetical protein